MSDTNGVKSLRRIISKPYAKHDLSPSNTANFSGRAKTLIITVKPDSTNKGGALRGSILQSSHYFTPKVAKYDSPLSISTNVTSGEESPITSKISRRVPQSTLSSAKPRLCIVSTSPPTSRRNASEFQDSYGDPDARYICSSPRLLGREEIATFQEPLISKVMKGREALIRHHEELTQQEHSEIWQYEDVYFLGLDAQKRREDFTDKKGFYSVVENDHLAFRYEVKKVLGKGSFGTVVEAYDHKREESVAVKLLKNRAVQKKHAEQELKLLEKVNLNDPEDNKSVVRMKNSFYFRGHLCIVFELLSLNLYDFMKSNSFQGLALPFIKRVAIQVLTGLKYIHSQGIVHCDLKPENILLKHSNKSSVKIIDFGSACESYQKIFTYLQSRYYRSPEIILGATYNSAIDMWSLGCILVELYTGRPLFQGESEHDQLIKIMSVLGSPPLSMIKRGYKRKLYFNDNNSPILVENKYGVKLFPGEFTLKEIVNTDDEYFLDFISCCLRYLPEDRLTAEKALRHKWIVGEKKAKIRVFKPCKSMPLKDKPR